MGARSPQIQEFETALISSASKTFEVMIGEVPKVGGKFGQIPQGVEISGVMLLRLSQTQVLVFLLAFPEDCIFEILQRIYKRSFNEINESVRQGVGELTNILFGKLRDSMNEVGHQIPMSLPNILVGSPDLVVDSNYQKSVVEFTLGEKKFFVLVGIGESEFQ